MSKKKITIGITAYNCHKYLLNAIKSVIDQGSDLWTGILILDGGADRKTRKIFEQFKHPKFQKYAFDENKGPFGTRAKAIELSKSEWYYQLDGDDLLPKDAIKLILETIDTHSDAEFVYGNCEHFSINNSKIKTPMTDCEALCFGPLFNTQSPIKKSLYYRLGGYCDELYINADWDFWISVFESGINGICINDVIYRRRHRKNNVASLYSHLRPEIVKKIITRHPEFFSINNRRNITLFKVYELLARDFRSLGKREDAYKHTIVAEKYGSPTPTLKEIKKEFKMPYMRYKFRRIIRQLFF